MGGLFSTPTSITLVPGLDSKLLGREWRCKYADGGGGEGGLINSKALEDAQKLFDDNLESLKKIQGVKGVHRIVCGACKDFKVIVVAGIDEFTAWESAEFAPEKEFLDKLRAIKGISNVETQKYTISKEDCKAEVAETLTVVPGVTTDTLAREWRLKYTKDEGEPSKGALIRSKSLEEAHKVAGAKIVSMDFMTNAQGMSSLIRIACGGCDDYKLIVTMPVKEFKAWEANEFKPEKDLLADLRKIDGVNTVESQTYTFMTYA
jgi:hypothetical protein